MSVQTEIDRLQTAKSELKSAIEAKGVTVPDAATLDGYGTLVSQIEQSRNTDTYVSLSFSEVTDGAFVAFLKTREGYQSITLHTGAGPFEVEAGSIIIFALALRGSYVHQSYYVEQGTYMSISNLYLDETLFGPDAGNARAMAFFSDSIIALTANNSSGGSGI